MDHCTVLFVDDEPLVLKGLQRMLRAERQNWTLRFAGSGREALSLLSREAFDAVVTDLRMPEMDGAELLKTIMQLHPHMVRIVLSGEMDPGMMLRAVRCAHQVLAKPCSADSLKATLARAFSLRRMISSRKLQTLLSGLESLPSLPALYTEILVEIQSSNASPIKIGQIIARDVGMTAKILQLINSAFFGLPRRILIPHEAVSLLGYDTVKALVLSAKIFSQFDPNRIAGLSLHALWQHSQAAALCARSIMAADQQARRSWDEAFTAGVLHDLGKLVLAQNFPDRYRAVLEQARDSRRPVWELEAECFGASHAELGAFLLGLWGLGEEVIAAIAHHHRPQEESSPSRVTAVVYAANLLEHRLSAAMADTPEAAVDEDHLRRLGIAGQLAAWEESCRRQRCEEIAHAE